MYKFVENLVMDGYGCHIVSTFNVIARVNHTIHNCSAKTPVTDFI